MGILITIVILVIGILIVFELKNIVIELRYANILAENKNKTEKL